MPLYYILSGLFFKDYGIETIFKKINKLIIPCLFFYILSFALTSAICMAVKTPIPMNFWDIFTQKEFHNIYLWFLISLFWTNIAFLALSRLVTRNTYQFCVIIGLVFLGAYLSKHNIELPLFMDSAFFSLPYFFFGYKLRQTQFLINSKTTSTSIITFLTCISIVFAGSFVFGKQGIDFRTCDITGYLTITYLTSISFVCAILTITKWIGHLPLVSYAGRYSLIILGLHFPIQYLLMLIYKNVGITPTPILYFIPMVVISVSLIPIFIKLFPYFTAQKDLIQYSHVTNLKTKIKALQAKAR